jgi:hypothetical protein
MCFPISDISVAYSNPRHVRLEIWALIPSERSYRRRPAADAYHTTEGLGANSFSVSGPSDDKSPLPTISSEASHPLEVEVSIVA